MDTGSVVGKTLFNVLSNMAGGPVVMFHGNRYFVLWRDTLSRKEKKQLRNRVSKALDIKGKKLFVMGFEEYIRKTTIIHTKYGHFQLLYLGASPHEEFIMLDGVVRWVEEDGYGEFRVIETPQGVLSSGKFDDVFTRPVLDEFFDELISNLETYGYSFASAMPQTSVLAKWEIEILPEHFHDYLLQNLPNYEEVFFVWHGYSPLIIFLMARGVYKGVPRIPRKDLEFIRSEMEYWGVKDYRVEIFGASPLGLVKSVYYPKFGITGSFVWYIVKVLEDV